MIGAEHRPSGTHNVSRQSDASPPRNARLAGLLSERTRDLLAWSDPDKCLFISVLILALTLWYTTVWYYTANHPEFAPYLDQAAVRVLIRLQALIIVAWTAVILACLAMRRARTTAPVLVNVTSALLACHLVYCSYFFGAYTHPFPSLTIAGCWAGGLLLFNRRTLTAALIFWWLALLGMTVAEQFGLLPYAPLYRDSPVRNAHLHSSWMVGSGGATLVIMLLVQVVIYFVIERWRDREAKLALASEQIAQANDVISRYVASQLAEHVRAGSHASLERHERRRLTLFFSDIEDFAATADQMEPEDLSGLLNEYLSEMTTIAESHGATIDKFVGDAIMIFFGAPAASSDRDQALRAVRMAIQMQDHLSKLREKWLAEGAEKPFHIRIGINTGQASVGAFGSRTRLEYTAIGRQVNLAARLQAQCERDRILVSHSTWALIHDEIGCTPKGEITLKGFQQPVKAYEVDQSASPQARAALGPSGAGPRGGG